MQKNINSEICPICRQKEEILFIRDFICKDKKYSLNQCQGCKIQFWLPFTIASQEFYEKVNPYQVRNLLNPEISRGYHKLFLKRHGFLKPGLKILDLGCGAGEFIFEAAMRGCEAWGVDFDRDAIEIAKNKFGLKDAYAMPFEDFFKKNLPLFDIICMFEVLEHLQYPQDFINKAKKFLKPGGKIVLSVPSRERMLKNLNGWDFPPHHFLRYNEESLLNLFSRENFFILYLSYVEKFKILSESVSGPFKTGLVNSFLSGKGRQKQPLFFVKIIYLMGFVKNFIISFLPASFLFLISIIIQKKNGIIYAELSQKP